jgi:hypothetical protein
MNTQGWEMCFGILGPYEVAALNFAGHGFRIFFREHIMNDV